MLIFGRNHQIWPRCPLGCRAYLSYPDIGHKFLDSLTPLICLNSKWPPKYCIKYTIVTYKLGPTISQIQLILYIFFYSIR